VGAAEQIYFSAFDAAFYKLSSEMQSRIESRLDEMGRRLGSFPHYHLTGSDRFRLRVGDYRIIYKFNLARNEIYLLNLGHRREIYR
jgi:mRNA interferase RelE/StbE